MAGLQAGGTPLRKSLEYCGRCGGATVYIKDESKNPFGTFKDRRCAAVLELHAAKEELILVHITSGNSGYSLGMMAQDYEAQHGRKRTVVNIVPRGIDPAIRKRLEGCSIVHEMELGKKIITQDEMAAIARKLTGYEGPADNIAGVEDYGLEGGYRQIVREIAGRGVRPDFIFCPVGEGELAVELAAASAETWSDRPPKIIGVSISQNVLARYLSYRDFMENPGKSIADKLVSGYSKFRALLNDHIRYGRAEIVIAGEGRIAKEYRYLNSIGIAAEPSAATAFVGAQGYRLRRGETAVIINTGKGIYNQKAVDRLWQRVLKRALRYAAVALASIAITAGAFLYKHEVERKNRLLELQRQELAMQVEWESLGGLEAQAARLLDRNGDSLISYGEYEDLFDVLTDKRNTAKRGLPSYETFLRDFTETELRHYVRYREMSRIGGNIEMDILRNMQQRYLRGTGRNEATLGERLSRIFEYRNVKVRNADGTGYCTFREFDMEHPFDPASERLCR